MRRKTTPSPGEFTLKERKGQSSDDQLEITSNQSKIENPLTAKETTGNEGLRTSLCQTCEAGVELSQFLSEFLSTTKRVDATHRDRDQKRKRHQHIEQELTRSNRHPKVEQTPREKFADTDTPNRLPLAPIAHKIKKVSNEPLWGRGIDVE